MTGNTNNIVNETDPNYQQST